MKRLCYLLGVTLFLYGSPPLCEAVVDRVVAVVNKEIITFSEIEKRMPPTEEGTGSRDRLEKQERMQALCRKVLDRLIEEKLIDQEAKKSGIKISSKDVEAALEEIKRKNSATQEDLERALAVEGLTVETYKKQLEKSLQRQKLLNLSVKIEEKPGERQLREFYQKNVGRYRTNETYRPAQILCAIRRGAAPEEVRDVRKRCQSVLDRIRKGEDFGEMALLYSEDSSNKDRGDLGYFRKGELLPVFEKEALRLKVGEVGGIIRTDFGFHIIKLLDRKGMDPLPFEEVLERVKADYYEDEIEKAFKQFLSTLKEKAIIEIKL